METLNTLFSSITTDGNFIIELLLFPLNSLEIILILMLSKVIFNLKLTYNNKLISTLLIIFGSIVNAYIIPPQFTILFSYTIAILISFWAFKTSIFKNSIMGLSSVLILNLINVVTINIFAAIFNTSLDLLYIVPFYKVSYMIASLSVIFLIIALFKHFKFRVHIVEDIDLKTKISFYLQILLGVITIVIQTILLFYLIDYLPIHISLLSSVTLSIYFIFTLQVLNNIFKLTIQSKKLAAAESYNKTLTTLHDSVRCFKHDFDNTLTTLGGYLFTKDYAGLEKYYQDLVKDSKKVNNMYILNPNIINNDGLYNLLTQKYETALSHNLNIDLTFLLDLSELRMNSYEFSKILGILLDNAIEASSQSENKSLNVIFRTDLFTNTQIVTIENSYKDEHINLDTIYKKGVTSKPNHTGLGLWETKKIIAKYSHINLTTTKNNTHFIQQIEFKTTKQKTALY